MSSKSIDILFDEAFENANIIPQDSVPQDTQLVLYGLYKQATSGSTNLYFQNTQDIRNAFKLNAWMQVKNLTINEAKQQYIDIINQL
ncbi:predicted protein, partial [Nematostella vectensis]